MNKNLQEELLILLILGELSTQEIELSTGQISKQVQKDWLDSISELAYSAPPVAISPELKSKVLQKIQLEALDFQPRRLGELTWKPHPVVKGIDMALLFSDPIRREVDYLVRCAPNVRYPAHRHNDLEKILIIDGEIEIEGEVYCKGDFLLSRPQSIHSPIVPNGCLFYVHTSFDDRFVEWTPGMVWQLLTHRWNC